MIITFTPLSEDAGDTGHWPSTSTSKIPSWFKKMPKFVGGEKKLRILDDGAVNSTVKWCNPFLDSLMTGYVINLEQDLIVSIENGVQVIRWRTGGTEVVSYHNPDQIPIELVPVGYNPEVFKFGNKWGVKTPNGYSTLFCHPLNRTDLPFITLSGVVDTDSYNHMVNLPFLIHAKFEGIIEAGTPIAQVIPIKRDPWSKDFASYNEEYSRIQRSSVVHKIYRAYKSLYWKRKEYK
jgi:hypothetical protein